MLHCPPPPPNNNTTHARVTLTVVLLNPRTQPIHTPNSHACQTRRPIKRIPLELTGMPPPARTPPPPLPPGTSRAHPHNGCRVEKAPAKYSVEPPRQKESGGRHSQESTHASLPSGKHHHTCMHHGSPVSYLLISAYPLSYLLISSYPLSYLLISSRPFSYLLIPSHPLSSILISGSRL